MILASTVLSQYTRVTDKRRQRTTDRQHLIGIAELAMQLQRSANNIQKMAVYAYQRRQLISTTVPGINLLPSK